MLNTRMAAGLAHHARAFPDKPALIVGDAVRTYGELEARVNRLAHALRRAGVGAGDTVGAALHNGFEWYELLNAAGKLGAQLVPIGYRLKGPEIAYMLGRLAAPRCCSPRPISPPRSTARSPSCAGRRSALWVVGPDAPWRGRAYEARPGRRVRRRARRRASSAAASTP